MSREVRVRFAPSPTGALHIGGVRTALYNYFFARQNGGKFILRIEDTDSQRFVEGAEDYIIESLKWSGIEIDEGVSVGGPHAPYRQSERKEIYLKYAQELVDNGWAYYAFDSQETLDALRAECEAKGETFSYNYSVREKMQTSLSLPSEEVKRRLTEDNHWVVRFKMPENEIVEMTDIVRGDMSVNTSTLDDKVLFKAIDELPTYHLANIVDDKLMDISHVIRGEEWLPSLPLHYMLYRAFGWSEIQPTFAHLPLLLKPVGKGKLSKRDGDKLGFPVFPLRWVAPNGEASHGYREDGYLPEAFVNMLSLLGWNPGNDQEIMSMQELTELFNIDKVGKSGSRFDIEKAKWFNAQYIKMTDNEILATELEKTLEDKGISFNHAQVIKAVGLVKDRATYLSDLFELSSYFFLAPESYDAKVVAKFWKEENAIHISKAKEMIIAYCEGLGKYDATGAETLIHEWIKTNGFQMGQIMNTLRLVLVGESKGPSIFEIIDVIGVDAMSSRIDSAIEKLG